MQQKQKDSKSPKRQRGNMIVTVVLMAVFAGIATVVAKNVQTSQKTLTTGNQKITAAANEALNEANNYVGTLSNRPTTCLITKSKNASGGIDLSDCSANAKKIYNRINDPSSVDVNQISDSNWKAMGNAPANSDLSKNALYLIEEVGCNTTARTRTYRISAKGLLQLMETWLVL